MASRETMEMSDTCVVRLYDENGKLKVKRDTSKPTIRERFAKFVDELRELGR